MAGCTGGLGPKAAENGAVTVKGDAHAVALLQAGAQLRGQRGAPEPHCLLPEVPLQGGPEGPVQLLHVLLKGRMHHQLGPATRPPAQELLLGLQRGRLQQGEGQRLLQRSRFLPLGLAALRLQGPVESQLQRGLLLQPLGGLGAGGLGLLPGAGCRLLLWRLLRFLLPQLQGRPVLPVQALQSGQQLSDRLWGQGEARVRGRDQPRWG